MPRTKVFAAVLLLAALVAVLSVAIEDVQGPVRSSDPTGWPWTTQSICDLISVGVYCYDGNICIVLSCWACHIHLTAHHYYILSLPVYYQNLFIQLRDVYLRAKEKETPEEEQAAADISSPPLFCEA